MKISIRNIFTGLGTTICDYFDKVIRTGITEIVKLRDLTYSQTSPPEPEFTNEICTVVEFRDGTLLDVIYKVVT